MFMKHYAPNRCCEPSIIEALNFNGGGGGDQGRCEQRIEVFVTIQFFFFFLFFFWGGGGFRSGRGSGRGKGQVGEGGRVRGSQGGYERRIEVFCENSKKKMGGSVRGGGVAQVGGSGWGVRMDMNEELKLL